MGYILRCCQFHKNKGPEHMKLGTYPGQSGVSDQHPRVHSVTWCLPLKNVSVGPSRGWQTRLLINYNELADSFFSPLGHLSYYACMVSRNHDVSWSLFFFFFLFIKCRFEFDFLFCGRNWVCVCVLVWMRMVSIGPDIWMLSHQIVKLLRKDWGVVLLK